MAVANRLQRCVRFGRPLGNELSTSSTRGTHVHRSAIEAVCDQWWIFGSGDLTIEEKFLQIPINRVS